jgi:hypothetical protein
MAKKKRFRQPMVKHSFAEIRRRLKIVHVSKEDGALVQGAPYACQHIAAEIKAGKVTLEYVHDPALKKRWIAACKQCTDAVSVRGSEAAEALARA